VRLSDSKLGRPGPGITSERSAAQTRLPPARRKRAKRAESFAILGDAAGSLLMDLEPHIPQ
jgi:hypothetical protein